MNGKSLLYKYLFNINSHLNIYSKSNIYLQSNLIIENSLFNFDPIQSRIKT